MPTYFKDPSLLTRVRLKKELHANGIHLPDKEQPKAFYVKMYRQHLSPLAWDSGVSIPSEQEVVPESLDDVQLRSLLIQHGVNAGPITDTTRKLYKTILKKHMSRTPQFYVDDNDCEDDDEEEDEEEEEEDYFEETDFPQRERTDMGTSPGRPPTLDDSMELRQRKFETSQRVEHSTEPERQRGGSTLWRIILVLLAVLGICVGVIFYFLEANPPEALPMKSR